MKQGKMLPTLLFVTCLLLAAVLCLAVFWPRGEKLTLVLQNGGEVTVSGAVEKTVDSDKTLRIKAGEPFTLTATGEISAFCVAGVRVEAREVELTMPDGPLVVEALTGAGEKFDVYTPDVLVYEAQTIGSRAVRPFFPAVTQAEDGTIIVVYYSADGHALYNQSEGKLSGTLKLVRSADGGKTFSSPVTLVDLTDEDRAKGDFNREARDPNLQKLSDGTLVLTFPVRAPIGKAGLNGKNPNDYWSERTYYMTSADNGATWSDMAPIECDYFSNEPFLYDDPSRTTGCWVKNGTMAELSDGTLLIPLYGAADCSSRAAWENVVVRARLDGNGTLVFDKEWGDAGAAKLRGAGEGDEVALTASSDSVYALCRTKIPSKTRGGEVYRSADGGLTWEKHALIPTDNDCLNQPYFTPLGGELVLVNYTVPLASVYNSPARRTARPVYGQLVNLKTGDFGEYDPITLYDSKTASVADMGNAASVLLSDGRIFTVFYDTSAPSLRKGFIGAKVTTLDDYLTQGSPSLTRTLAALTESVE